MWRPLAVAGGHKVDMLYYIESMSTELGYKVLPRLRELAPYGKREPGGGIRAT